jgi:hypothetical protein
MLFAVRGMSSDRLRLLLAVLERKGVRTRDASRLEVEDSVFDITLDPNEISHPGESHEPSAATRQREQLFKYYIKD